MTKPVTIPVPSYAPLRTRIQDVVSPLEELGTGEPNVTEWCLLVAAVAQGKGSLWPEARTEALGEELALLLLRGTTECLGAEVSEYCRITDALTAYLASQGCDPEQCEMGVWLKCQLGFFRLPAEIEGEPPDGWFYPSPEV